MSNMRVNINLSLSLSLVMIMNPIFVSLLEISYLNLVQQTAYLMVQSE